MALVGHVGLPRGIKETEFFDKHYHKGLKWYEDYFRHCPAGLPIGEICPTYWISEQARKRISLHIPRCRIVCTFRDPVERIYSDYKLMRQNVWTRVGFEEAIAKHRRMAETNRYAHYLAAWRQRFGKQNVLVCLYDDFRADPQAYIDRVCSFVGIAGISLTQSPVGDERTGAITHAPRSRHLAQNARHVRDWLNSHRAHRVVDAFERLGVWTFCFGGGEKFLPLEPDVEERVRKRFGPEVEAFEELIGRDLSAWKRCRSDGPTGADVQVWHASRL